MSIHIHNVQRIRGVVETTFCTDQSGSLGGFTDIPFREGTASVELNPASVDPGHAVQRTYQYRKEVLGGRSAKLSMTLNLASTGTGAGSATAAVQGALGMLLAASMGGEELGTGSTVASAASGSGITATSGAGFKSGSAAAWINSRGRAEAVPVQEVATNALTLKYSLSDTPTASDVIYSGASYYLTNAAPTDTLQFLVAGVGDTDRVLLMGGQLTAIGLGTDLTGGAVPSVQLTYEFADYAHADEATGTITGALGNASYTNYNPAVAYSGRVLFPTVGTDTYSTDDIVKASAISFAFKLAYQKITSPSGENTVLQWVPTRVAPVIEGSFTEPYENVSRFDARDARTDKAVWYQIGRTPGSIIVLDAPCVQVVNPQRVADNGGTAATTVAWKGREDEDVSGATTDLALSAFRIHLL